MVGIIGEIQRVVSRYLLVTLLINIGQGILVGIAMSLIGMPAPVVWGLLTVVAEFIPTPVSLVMVVLLGLAGLAGSPSAGHVLLARTLPPDHNAPEQPGQSGSLRRGPAAQSDRHSAGSDSLVFPLGVPGAFLAVPILAAFKTLCERVETLKPVEL